MNKTTPCKPRRSGPPDAAACSRRPPPADAGTGPELHRLLDQLREGDTVVVWKLDRLSRSLKDVLHIMEQIGDAGAGFRSITENIDTTTPAGRMMMQMVGAFAEFERAMIRERTSAGLAAARAEGRIGGRRKKLDAAKRREIAESVVTGRKSGADMARLYNVSHQQCHALSHTAPGWLLAALGSRSALSYTRAARAENERRERAHERRSAQPVRATPRRPRMSLTGQCCRFPSRRIRRSPSLMRATPKLRRGSR